MRAYSYDEKCEVLAQDFLEDEGPFTKKELQDLAQEIQNTIEMYLEYGRKREAADAVDRGVLQISDRPTKA